MDMTPEQLGDLLAAAMKPVVDQVAELSARVDEMAAPAPARAADGPGVELKRVGPAPLVHAPLPRVDFRYDESEFWGLTVDQQATYANRGGRGLYRLYRDACDKLQHHAKVAIIKDAESEDCAEAQEMSRDLLKRWD